MNYYIDKSELEVFYFNNVSNANFGLIVQEVEGLFDSFENDIEFIEVQGRNGELIVDNKRVKSRDLTIKGYVDKEETEFSIAELHRGLNKWLKGSMEYGKLEFIREAIGLSALCYHFKMKEIIQDLYEIEIKFRVQGEGIDENI